MKLTSMIIACLLLFFTSVLYAEDTTQTNSENNTEATETVNPTNDMGAVNLYSTPGDEDSVAQRLTKDGVLYYPGEGYLGEIPQENVRDVVPLVRSDPNVNHGQSGVQSPVLNSVRPTRPSLR